MTESDSVPGETRAIDIEAIQQNFRTVSTSPNWGDLPEILNWYKRDVGDLLSLLAVRQEAQERLKTLLRNVLNADGVIARAEAERDARDFLGGSDEC